MDRTAGAMFDPHDRFVYFIASNVSLVAQGARMHENLLTAVNEIGAEADMDRIKGWMRDGKRVFIDSGVFNLAMEHARRHNVSHDVGLSMAPDQIDGFGELFDKYVDVARRIGENAWGYIEIDQGGRENKLKTRAKLEGMGLRPIPVYHPMTDGWEYFDYLAERYDRICFGNVVMADRPTRLRLVATAWERMRKYPGLWIHLLGLTPNEWLNAMPSSSGDSSSWLRGVRWAGGYKEQTALKVIGFAMKDFQYQIGMHGDDEKGATKSVLMGAYGSYLNQRNWRNHLQALERLGCDPLPATLGGAL